MGRSVSYPSNAAAVTFGTFDGEDEYDWLDLVDEFRMSLRHLFPSASREDEWLGREDHAVAGNGHALFGLSEYGGLVSYWMVPREDTYGDISPLSQAWCDRAAAKFEAAFGEMVKVGTFSNGGGVYGPKPGAGAPADNLDTNTGHLVINGLLTDG